MACSNSNRYFCRPDAQFINHLLSSRKDILSLSNNESLCNLINKLNFSLSNEYPEDTLFCELIAKTKNLLSQHSADFISSLDRDIVNEYFIKHPGKYWIKEHELEDLNVPKSIIMNFVSSLLNQRPLSGVYEEKLNDLDEILSKEIHEINILTELDNEVKIELKNIVNEIFSKKLTDEVKEDENENNNNLIQNELIQYIDGLNKNPHVEKNILRLFKYRHPIIY